MSSIPTHLKYTSEHEWIEVISDNRVRVGITDFAQHALGDIVYILTPKVGDHVRAGAVCGEIESTKSVSEIYAPVTGEISAINDAVLSNPESLNSSPYGAGWLFEIDAVSQTDIAALLDDQAYAKLTAAD